MAKSAHILCPCGLTHITRPHTARPAHWACLQKAMHPNTKVAVYASKQDPEPLSLSMESQSLNGNPQNLKTYQKRRWSNLSRGLVHVPGTVIGSATLIAGTTIGAFFFLAAVMKPFHGMLAHQERSCVQGPGF